MPLACHCHMVLRPGSLSWCLSCTLMGIRMVAPQLGTLQRAHEADFLVAEVGMPDVEDQDNTSLPRGRLETMSWGCRGGVVGVALNLRTWST